MAKAKRKAKLTQDNLVSRREVLKSLLAMGAVAVTAPAVASQAQTTKRVIVIGAGAAGIAAASRLQREGHTVLVLEARDRIGGRVNTNRTLSPHPIELGAEFLHGDEVVTWDYVEAFGLRTLEAGIGSTSYVHSNGKLQDATTWQREMTGIDGSLEDVLWDAADLWIRGGGEDMTLDELIDASEMLQDLRDPSVRRVLDNMYGEEVAAGTTQHGVYGIVEAAYDGDGSGDFRVQSGYSTLLARMSTGLDIRLNTPVRRIDTSGAGATVEAMDGTSFTADAVIVTLPLAVLKKRAVEFNPPLPDWKWEAVDALGAGKVDKVILRFKERFWPANLGELFTDKTLQVWWQPGDGRADAPPILTSNTGGANGALLADLTAEEAIQLGLRELSDIFGQDVSRFFDTGVFTGWGADPYSGMGYSYVPPEAYGYRADLAEPVGNALFFAGEATNSVRPACVHGAIESGLRAAKEVMG
jgi:monoamine oxidase